MAAPAITNLIQTASATNGAGSKNAEAQADGEGFSSVLRQKIQAERPQQAPRPTTESARQAPSAEKPAPSDTPTDEIALAPVDATLPPPSTIEGILPWLNSETIQALPVSEAGLPSIDGSNQALEPAQNEDIAATLSPLGLLVSAETSRPQAPLSPGEGEARHEPGFMRPLIHPTTTQAPAETATNSILPATDEAANLASQPSTDLSGPTSQIRTTEAAMPAFAQALTHATEGRSKEAASVEPQTTTLRNPVASSEWASELGDRLVWMSNRLESRAEMVLTPPQLGKIEISLHVTGEQASVSFVSANPQVRDALESSINRLREVLAENGISLGQANVGAESSGQGFSQTRQGLAQTSADTSPATISPLPWQQKGNGMVDIFA